MSTKWLIIGLSPLAVIGLLAGVPDRSDTGNPNTASSACYMAQRFVTDSLRAPASASFQSCNNATVEQQSEYSWRVSSYVDSQNGFGAQIRTHYSALVTLDGVDKDGTSRWKLVSLDHIP